MMRTLILILLTSCALLPDGEKALSVEQARAVIAGVADDVAVADLNGDGMLQLDSDSGLPLAMLQELLRGSAEDMLASDTNGDGMLDSREMLGGAPMLAMRVHAAAQSLETRPADGDAVELAVLSVMLANRLHQAMR